MDVEPCFTIAVKSAESQSAEAVKALITAKNLSTDTEGDIVTVKEMCIRDRNQEGSGRASLGV